MIYLSLALITFTYVSLRAFQQKNVMHSKYWWMAPTSYGMALCDVYIISSISHSAPVLIIAAMSMGTGGAIGSIIATYLHDRWNGNGH